MCLTENPVASKEVCILLVKHSRVLSRLTSRTTQNYRYYAIWRCPAIRFLDFQKVRDTERAHAKELFGTYDAPTDLAQSISSQRSKGFAPAGVNGTAKKSQVKFDEKEKARFERLVKKASSFQKIQELEKMFAEGRLPSGGDEDDVMDET